MEPNLSSYWKYLLFDLFWMQLTTLHHGDKCSWHDCSRLMSFPPNRDWFNLHDIYLSIQSLALWGPWQSSHTYWTYSGIIISPIDCPGFNTCHLRLLAYRRAVIVHTARSAFQTEPASISAGVRALCMRPNCSGLRPQRPSSRRKLAGPQSQPHRFPITVSLWRPL